MTSARASKTLDFVKSWPFLVYSAQTRTFDWIPRSWYRCVNNSSGPGEVLELLFVGGFPVPALRISLYPDSWSVTSVSLVPSAVIMDSEIRVRLKVAVELEVKLRLEVKVWPQRKLCVEMIVRLEVRIWPEITAPREIEV